MNILKACLELKFLKLRASIIKYFHITIQPIRTNAFLYCNAFQYSVAIHSKFLKSLKWKRITVKTGLKLTNLRYNAINTCHENKLRINKARKHTIV